MPTKEDRLQQIVPKIDRAQHHLGELERSLKGFMGTNPYRVGAKHDPETRKLVYFVSSVAPVPSELSMVAGDIVQNLVSALDHLAYQLVSNDTNDNPPNPRGVYFPVADSKAKYDETKANRLSGARAETLAAVDAVQPFKDGNRDLWLLHRLNNIDKHRLLLTVGSVATGINVGQLIAGISNSPFTAEEAAGFAAMGVFLLPADNGFPLREGHQLFIGDVDEKPNPEQQFKFDVALHEAGIIEGAPLLDTMKQLTEQVKSTLNALMPRLA